MNFDKLPSDGKQNKLSRRDFLRLGVAAATAKIGLEASPADAVEIAEDLGLEQGFQKLHKAVFSDEFETSADAVVLSDGRTKWSYTEGNTGNVKTTWSESVILTEGQSKDMEVGIHIHNHPIESVRTAGVLGTMVDGYSNNELQGLLTGPSWGDMPVDFDASVRAIKFQQYLERNGQERGIFSVIDAGGVWLFRQARPEDLLDSKVGQEKLNQILEINNDVHNILRKKILEANISDLDAVMPGGMRYLLDEYINKDYVEFGEPERDKRLRLFWYPLESESDVDLRLSFARFLAHQEMWLDRNTMRGRESKGSAALKLSAEELQNYSDTYLRLLQLRRSDSDGWEKLRLDLIKSSIQGDNVQSAIETFLQQALINYLTKMEFINKDNLSELRRVANKLADTANVESEVKKSNGFW
jgi:hypothetical protein